MRAKFNNPASSLLALLAAGVLYAPAALAAGPEAPPAGQQDATTEGTAAVADVAPEAADAPAPLETKPAFPASRAILRLPPPSAESVHVAPGSAGNDCHAPVVSGDVPFAFSYDGKPVAQPGETAPVRNAADSQRCVDLALKSADVQIRYDGLNLEPRLNVVAAPDAALRGQSVVFRTHANYSLLIERGEVRVFAKDKTIRQTPIAVIPVKRGEARWSIPEDVREHFEHVSLKDTPKSNGNAIAAPTDPLKDGVVYVLRVYDAQGRFDETAAKDLEIAHVRGGQVYENDLKAVYNGNALDTRNIPISGGAILVSGRNIPAGFGVTVMGVPAPVDSNGNFAIRQLVAPGAHDIDVAISDTKGKTSVFSRGALIPDHDFFYVALADMTVGKNNGNSELALQNPTKTDEYKGRVYADGRLAFYLKGKVLGDTLITAAADTREQPVNHLFSNFDSKDPTYLLRNLDPNKYYQVYGDDSTLAEDAPTRGKFYVRVERGDNSIMWGNFKTRITGTEFVRYERGLYGARMESKTAEQTSAGERRGQVETFVAEPGTLGARDVFRGTGGSLYYMSRANITQGSERVTAEIRDATTGIVLQTRTLTATQDYDVNYLQGRIVLHSPLASTASGNFAVMINGSGSNDQYLVVNYEYAPGLTATTDKVAGGRASYWVNDHVQVGVTGYDQTTPGQSAKIAGADATLRATPGTYLKVEGARSNGPGSGENISIDGGFSFNAVTTAGATAYAKRVEAATDLSDIIHGSEGRISAFWKDKDRDFSGPGELAVNRAVRQEGVNAIVKLSDRWTSRSKFEGSDDQFRNYKAGEQNFVYTFNDYWKGTIGARVDNNHVNTLSASPTLNQNGMRADVVVRADYDSKRDWGTYAYGQATAAKSGEREANNRLGMGGNLRLSEKLTAMAEVSGGNNGLGAKVGTEYKIDEKRSSYLNYGLDPDRTDIINRGGAGILTSGTRQRYSDSVSVFGEEKVRYGGGYSGLTHAFGLDFVPYVNWKAGLSIENGRLTDPLAGDAQRTAISASGAYAHGGLVYSGKYEYRHDDITSLYTGERAGNTYLMHNALSVKINPEWRFIGKLNGSYSTSSVGDFFQGNYFEGVSAFAYRPINNDRFNALFKYTYFYDVPSSLQAASNNNALGNFSQQSNILSADGSYDLNQWFTVGAKYAYRLGELKDNSVGGPWQDSGAHLVIGRLDFHIVKDWDVMGEMRMLTTIAANSTQVGALAGVYRNVNDNFKIGVGYNFTRFSDDLTNLRNNNQGVFVNAVGKY